MNPVNAKVRAIVRREYLQRVRSKWFLFSTLGIPVLLVALALLSGWLVTRDGAEPDYRVAVVDRSGTLGALVAEELIRDSIFAMPLEEWAALPEDSLSGRLLESSFNVAVLIPPGALDPPDPGADRRSAGFRSLGLQNGWGAVHVRALAREGVGTGARRTIQQAVSRALVTGRLQEAGLGEVDAAGLLRQAEVSVVGISEDGARSQEAFQAISFVLALMFYMVLLVYGQMIVRSILEEKTSDIVEVMVSSVRPWELMLGKIVGVGAVGLTQVAIWGAALAGLTLYGLSGTAAALAEAGVDLSTVRVPLGLVVGILCFLVLGYLLYAGLFAGTGATLSREEDAQQASLPVVILIALPFIMAQGVIEHPDTALSVALSLVPFFSPLLMPARMLVTSVPAWQLAAAFLLMAATTLAIAWLAGRIYRVGILMKGKRPNLPELVRWVRHG